MSGDEELLAIKVTAAANQIAAIKALRASTGLSMAEIKTAINHQTPIAVTRLHGLDHDENEQALHRLFKDLDQAGIEFELILNGRVESRQFFNNAMQTSREIGVEVEMISDLKSGEPCIQTLEWLKTTSPKDVFQQTIRQIIHSNDYNVDAETLAWAKQQASRFV